MEEKRRNKEGADFNKHSVSLPIHLTKEAQHWSHRLVSLLVVLVVCQGGAVDKKPSTSF